jgi:hypothetical protein
MAGETSKNTQGGTAPSKNGTTIITPPKPPDNWWDIPGWYEYAQGQAVVQLVPPVGHLQEDTLAGVTLARRKREIAAKKARQAAWRAAQAKRRAAAAAAAKAEAAAAAAAEDERQLEYVRGLEIFTPDPFTKKLGKFNPPPHKFSRSNSPIAFTGRKIYENEAYSTSTSFTANEPYENFQYTSVEGSGFAPVAQSETELASRSFQRGLIYQDSDSAMHLDGSIVTGIDDLWGFQFMYNPNSISITTNVSTSIDYGNTKDIANQLAGSQNIQFSLLLNRIADLSVNDSWEAGKYKGDTALDSTQYLTYAYGAVLSTETLEMIKTRGTEYDLEFLYRVLNGDPQPTPMLRTLVSDETSDFGYISGIPVWLRFNNNVKYKGVIQSISVEHKMFNANMVPTLTEVGISFNRIPVVGYGNAASQGKAIKKSTKNSIYLKETKAK